MKGIDNPPSIEKEEYDFERGVEHAVKRIEELLQSKDVVVVSIAGPIENDTNVGKTHLTGYIGNYLWDHGIPYTIATSYNDLSIHDLNQLKSTGENFQTSKAVIIFEGASSPGFVQDQETDQYATFFMKLENNATKNAGKSVGLEEISGVDLRIFIYRPDRNIYPADKLYADVIIKNELAKDKK